MTFLKIHFISDEIGQQWSAGQFGHKAWDRKTNTYSLSFGPHFDFWPYAHDILCDRKLFCLNHPSINWNLVWHCHMRVPKYEYLTVLYLIIKLFEYKCLISKMLIKRLCLIVFCFDKSLSNNEMSRPMNTVTNAYLRQYFMIAYIIYGTQLVCTHNYFISLIYKLSLTMSDTSPILMTLTSNVVLDILFPFIISVYKFCLLYTWFC